jgi:hypothetical protein
MARAGGDRLIFVKIFMVIPHFRVTSYISLLHDAYPPFSLEDQ